MSSIRVSVETQYVEEQSQVDHRRFVYTYTILIENQGDNAAQLISRHWIITDANEEVQEVIGQGVVGEQPYLKPGESYRYTSGVVLNTPTGMMRGSYTLRCDDGIEFKADIPAFSLVVPKALH